MSTPNWSHNYNLKQTHGHCVFMCISNFFCVAIRVGFETSTALPPSVWLAGG